MTSLELEPFIAAIFQEIEKQIPEYENSPDDWSISQGNVAACIITEEGKIYGKLFGSDKLKQRQYFSVAWNKASQVWITGMKTGAYERHVFGGEMDPEDSPIDLPDLIGWIGGQPIRIDDETQLSVGFSGFQGVNDLRIVEKAVKAALNRIKSKEGKE